tara:strand:+ start:761 stop:2083 length:1323 start_codon:yes stop_codon:yes gene_type:complete
MKENLNINKYINNLNLKKIFKKLYPICRSITGEGFEKSLDILSSASKLNKKKVKSGTKVLDWIIPDEWNIVDAYVKEKNKKIIDFKKHNLHIVNYSDSVDKIVSYKELVKHLHYLPKIPNAIPYLHSYYKKYWGFCLKYNQFKKLNKKGKFKVKIDSSFKKGNLIYSDNLIPGKSKEEILIYTYLCHPQMANHELSGPLAWLTLYEIIKNTKPHKYSYRFVICPENIGAATFLHYNKKKIKNIKAGYILNCLGHGKIVTFKKSRIGNSLADKAASNVIKHSGYPYKILDFFPEGSDERQFCSPGFNLPISLVMRKMYRTFKEYHTSLDDEKFINFKTIEESIKLHYNIILTLENNFTPKAKIIYGTPQLSRSKVDLYPQIMKSSGPKKSEEVKLLLEILNLADGKEDLLDICEKKGYELIKFLDLYKRLLKSGYITKVKK